MPLTVPPKVQCHLTVVEDVEKRLPVLFAKNADVPCLLAPSAEVDIGGESVEGHI